MKTTKYCPKCKQQLLLSLFSKGQGWCKECFRQRNKELMNTPGYAEKNKERQARYQKKHKDVAADNAYCHNVLKPQALKRDCNMCSLCPSMSNLVIHHIETKLEAPHLIRSLDNILTVCASCHYKLHNNKDYKSPVDNNKKRLLSLLVRVHTNLANSLNIKYKNKERK